LIGEAGLHADRLPVNIELPTEASLATSAPEKDASAMRKHIGDIRLRREASEDRTLRGTEAPTFAPAGRSTQMIVGANGTSDATTLQQSARLYGSYGLMRVYYSAFFGTRTVDRILRTRHHLTLRYDDLLRRGASLRKAQPFIELPNRTPGALLDTADLRARFAPEPEQLSLF
jgi:predicted DNA-binding helix-hairpin-helix protein